jgi:hypothetical protein
MVDLDILKELSRATPSRIVLLVRRVKERK